MAETLKKVAKAEEVVSKVEEEEEVEEKDIDLFSESAMYNAYGICHNVQVEWLNVSVNRRRKIDPNWILNWGHDVCSTYFV